MPARLDFDEVCAEVLAAVEKVLDKLDMEEPVAVVNIAWKTKGYPSAIGTRVAKHANPLLVDSLFESVAEARARWDGSGEIDEATDWDRGLDE